MPGRIQENMPRILKWFMRLGRTDAQGIGFGSFEVLDKERNMQHLPAQRALTFAPEFSPSTRRAAVQPQRTA